MKGSDFVIKKTFIASTSHVEQEDFSVLHETNIITEDYEYGTRIYLDQEYDDHPMSVMADSIVDYVSKYSFSEGFKLIVLFAVSLNCNWLELDADGPIYKEFPEYE